MATRAEIRESGNARLEPRLLGGRPPARQKAVSNRLDVEESRAQDACAPGHSGWIGAMLRAW
jgi:hypothetical protein